MRPKSYIQNGPVAVGASRRKQMMVVGLAVRLAVAFEEILRAQLLAAVGAHEMLRMPGPSERRHHLFVGSNKTKEA